MPKKEVKLVLHRFNYRAIAKVLGALLGITTFFQIIVCLLSLIWDRPGSVHIGISSFISLCMSTGLWLFGRKAINKIDKRDGYIVVSIGWLLMCISAMMPYVISGTIPNLTNAFFETMSGMTTTGASILNDIESMPKSILLWRSMTQWLGGMGIIVLTVALFPLLGMGGIELFVAEAPGPTSDKISPRIRDTAKILWLIYISLTAILSIIYFLLGMTYFDALNHAFTTMATGGFSTKNSSMILMSPAIQYVCTLFMLIAGVNYTILFFAITGRFKRVIASDELKAYLVLLLISITIVTMRVHISNHIPLEQSFREVSFQIVSLVTTTGYVSADYTSWTPGLTTFFVILLFVGACAGSTSGGIKIVRHLIIFKNTMLEFKRILHPRAIIRVKFNKSLVAARVMTHVLVFLIIYMCTFAIFTLIVSAFGLDLATSIGAVATSLGNVGPGIGDVGPLNNFAGLPSHIKLILTFVMLIGRLELFSVLILFTPYFWKTN